MEDPVADAILNQYFRRLEQALSGLTPERRAQIVEDLRAHVDECLQAESDHSDATILAILDRVGDPDEIAREAMADDTMPSDVIAGAAERAATKDGAATRSLLSTLRSSWRLTMPSVAILIAAVVVVIVLSSSQSPAAPTKSSGPTVHGRLVAAHTDPRGSGSGGWLPATDVSGDHQSPGASDCSPQTTSGSESVSALEAGATQVASGTTAGQSWSLWSKNGQSGANGLETGGIVVGSSAYGLCPGFPNPGEMELLEPSGGGDGIAYGVVGYPGTAKVAIYGDTFGNFATTKLIGSTTAQTANGVGFFITSLSESACDVAGVEMNTASSSASTEHNLAFADSHCKDGQLVPISDSQGIWGLPTSGFPDKFQSANGGGGGGGGAAPLTNGWLPASDISGGGGIDNSDCGPQTTSGSESASTLEAGATQVASGTTAGQSWSLWSKNGQSGASGLEDGGVVVGGVAYGLCPGFPNPAEMELLEPSGGGDGIAYGVVGYAGSAKVAIYSDTFGNFATTKLVGSTTAQTANGVGFFITSLSESACDLAGVEMNTASSNYAAEHNLAFSTSDCKDGQLVPISDSQGIWQLPTKRFPDKFQSFNGGGGSVSTPTLGNTARMYNSHKAAKILLSRYRILKTSRVAPRMLPAMVERMSSHVGVRLGLDTSDVAKVQPARGVTMWLIPGMSGFCGIELDNNGGGGGSCGRIHGGLGPGTTGSDAQGALADGFAPNGVTRVTVSLAGGRKLSVPVRDNAYFVRIPGARITGVRASPR